MAPKRDTGDKVASDEIRVRVNPDLWQTNFIELGGDRVVGHDAPFLVVKQSEFDEKLSKLTVTVSGSDGEAVELQQIVPA